MIGKEQKTFFEQEAEKLVSLEDIEMALARGYCSKRNASKVVDTDLIQDMALEVRAILEARI